MSFVISYGNPLRPPEAIYRSYMMTFFVLAGKLLRTEWNLDLWSQLRFIFPDFLSIFKAARRNLRFVKEKQLVFVDFAFLVDPLRAGLAL
jgi:hypothetical protein